MHTKYSGFTVLPLNAEFRFAENTGLAQELRGSGTSTSSIVSRVRLNFRLVPR